MFSCTFINVCSRTSIILALLFESNELRILKSLLMRLRTMWPLTIFLLQRLPDGFSHTTSLAKTQLSPQFTSISRTLISLACIEWMAPLPLAPYCLSISLDYQMDVLIISRSLITITAIVLLPSIEEFLWMKIENGWRYKTHPSLFRKWFYIRVIHEKLLTFTLFSLK